MSPPKWLLAQPSCARPTTRFAAHDCTRGDHTKKRSCGHILLRGGPQKASRVQALRHVRVTASARPEASPKPPEALVDLLGRDRAVSNDEPVPPQARGGEIRQRPHEQSP